MESSVASCMGEGIKEETNVSRNIRFRKEEKALVERTVKAANHARFSQSYAFASIKLDQPPATAQIPTSTMTHVSP